MRPPFLVAGINVASVVAPPIGVALLASALRSAGHDVVVIDAVGEGIDDRHPTEHPPFWSFGLSLPEVVDRIPAEVEVIGVACPFSHDWPHTRRLLDAIGERFPDALLVVGGEHATAVPDELLDDCPAVDVVVLGEGERTLVDLVEHRGDLAGAESIPGTVWRSAGAGPARAPAERMTDRDRLPRPAWDLVPLDAYLDRGLGIGIDSGRSLPILATRGCPYRCTFCSSPQMWTTRYVARSPGEVLDEISEAIEVHGIDDVEFYDLTMIIRRSWILEFCQLIEERGLQFTWQLPSGTRSEAVDAEVCRALHRAGCRKLTFAPESGSPEVLELIKKRVDLDHLKTAIRVASGVGISCTANIIVGFPGERRRDVLQTLRFVWSLSGTGLETCTIAPFSPYPGSEIFDDLRRAGRIGPLDDRYYLGLSYADLARAASWNEQMGARELQLWRWAAFAGFYVLTYLRRPSRFVRTWRAVVRGGPQASRLEQALRDFWVRFARRSGSPSRPLGEGVAR